MKRHSLVISSSLVVLFAVGCDSVGTISPEQGAGDSKSAPGSSSSGDLQSEINSPPHQSVLDVQSVGNETIGNYSVPGVGRVTVKASRESNGDLKGFFSLNDVPYYETVFSPTHPERESTNGALGVLGLNEAPGRTLALATAEIWSELVRQGSIMVGPNGEPLEAFGGGCSVETETCSSDCRSIIFGTKCKLCVKVKCSIDW